MKVKHKMTQDRHKPLYHFTSDKKGRAPFDPNGAIFWKGRYHLFFLSYNPCSWGHASSANMVDWKIHPVALTFDELGDEKEIYSGGAFINKEGVPTIIYHGVGVGTCIAFSEDDELIRWRKSKHNPVIPEPVEGASGWGVYNVFDPHAWLEDGVYQVILGGKVKPHDSYDTAYLFQSDDLVNWRYVRPFYNPNPKWTKPEEDCACPDFFKLGDRHVLMCISHPYGARYYLGRYMDGHFVPEEHHRMNWPGGPCFATESLIDSRGRRVFWAWAMDQRKSDSENGYPGVMTLPRVISLNAAGKMLIEPVEELKCLRGEYKAFHDFTLPVDEEMLLEGVTGDLMELFIESEMPSDSRFIVKVGMSVTGDEFTSIVFDSSENTLSIDTTHSSLGGDVIQKSPILILNQSGYERKDVRVQKAPFEMESGETLRLRVFIDKSMLEVYANCRQCLTQRIYPSLGSDSIAVGVSGNSAFVRSIDSWRMRPSE